jgi:hypothetical protein
VRQGIVVSELNLLDHLTGFGVVLEEGVQIGVGAPQPFPLPSDSVGTIAHSRELELDHPVFRIDAIDGPRRRDCDPEFAVSPLQAMCAGSDRPASQHLALLESTDSLTLTGPLTLPWRALSRPLGRCRGQRAAPVGRISNHTVNDARPGSEVLVYRLSGRSLGLDDLAAIGRGNPDRIAVKRDAAGSVGFRIERTQDLAIAVAHQVRPVIALVDDP